MLGVLGLINAMLTNKVRSKNGCENISFRSHRQFIKALKKNKMTIIKNENFFCGYIVSDLAAKEENK